jgi:hypothetical protein
MAGTPLSLAATAAAQPAGEIRLNGNPGREFQGAPNINRAPSVVEHTRIATILLPPIFLFSDLLSTYHNLVSWVGILLTQRAGRNTQK